MAEVVFSGLYWCPGPRWSEHLYPTENLEDSGYEESDKVVILALSEYERLKRLAGETP